MMAITIYRRHSADCPVQKSAVLNPRAKRLLLDGCDCPIWIYGRSATEFIPRQKTGTRDLKEAEAIRASYDARGKAAKIHGPLLEDCIHNFLKSAEAKLSETSLSDYHRNLGRLQTFASARGAQFIRDLTVDHLEIFKVDGLPPMQANSKATVWARICAFLKTAYRRGWILEPLVEKLEREVVQTEMKEPYTDAEVDRILLGAGEAPQPHNSTQFRYAAKPQTFRLLMELMLETGLRLGDATAFDPRVAVRGERMWIYRFRPEKLRKNKTKRIEAFLTPALKEAIDSCEWMSPALPFNYPVSPKILRNAIRYRMQQIGKKYGIADCRPHRLRDTFAVRKLLKGFSLEDVSRLLGHSSVTVTETYYAKWITARQDRLERLIAESVVEA